eukprot:4423475-Pyramimonas_sp.AAC.1
MEAARCGRPTTALRRRSGDGLSETTTRANSPGAATARIPPAASHKTYTYCSPGHTYCSPDALLATGCTFIAPLDAL